MATLDQTKGSGKDLQGVLGRSRPDITATVYMQQIESGVRQTLDAICSELMAKRELGGRRVTFFPKVWYGLVQLPLDDPQVIESKQQARSSVG